MNNPITARLTANRGAPSVRLLIGAAVVLLTATSVISLLLWNPTRARVYAAIYATSLVIAAAIPVLIGPMVAAFTTADLRQGTYELLRATLLSPARIVRGYLFAAAHRLRLALAVGVVLLQPIMLLLHLGRPYAVPLNPRPYLGISLEVWLAVRISAEAGAGLLRLALAAVVGVGVGLHRPKAPVVMTGIILIAATAATLTGDRAILSLFSSTIRPAYVLHDNYAQQVAHEALSTLLGSTLPLLVLTGAAWWAAHRGAAQ